MNLDDEKWMARTLELAGRSLGKCRPNPAVGSVVVSSGGNLLGEGWHTGAGRPHAEVEAIQDVRRRGNDPGGACLYVNLEPCNHHGRTPPCCDAILEAGIRRVVISQRDPNLKARGGVERLREAGVEVVTGIGLEKALRINDAFNVYHTFKQPLLTMKWAMTMDGCTSLPNGDSKWITGELARQEVHRRRARHDAVLAGIGTVMRDGARLTARLAPDDPDQPPAALKRWRIVLDTRLSLPVDAPFLEPSAESTPLVICGPDIQKERHIQLEDRGAKVLPLKTGSYGISLPDLSFALFDMGIQSVYIEGGRRVGGAMNRHGLVHRVECWLGARVAGGAAAPHLGPLASPAPLEIMGDARHLHDTNMARFGTDFLMEGWLLDWNALAKEPTFV